MNQMPDVFVEIQDTNRYSMQSFGWKFVKHLITVMYNKIIGV